jgi:hypothetical protein
MPDPKPMNVYPDPDGGSNANTAPSDTRLTGGALAAAAGAAGALAVGSGTAPDPIFLFLQAANYRGPGYMGFHAASSTYVAIAFVLAAVSAVLSAVNLIYGLRMKERLRHLSERVTDVCEKNGVFDWYKKTNTAA